MARSRDIPSYAQAVLSGLNFCSADPNKLAALSMDEWTQALQFCDNSQLSLPLYLRCGQHLPAAVRSRLAKNLNDNRERWERLKQVYGILASALEREGILFAVLKGFSQYPLFVPDPRHRAQYDIDLLVRSEQVHRAARVAALMGYEPVKSRADLPTDHLPTMIRRTNWHWREDYFDPEIPFSLELHFRCWDPKAEHFGPQDLEKVFWERIGSRTCEELLFQSLHPADSVLYAALHVLRHILHGNLKAFHVYELAYFLEQRAEDDPFWQQWSGMHDQSLQEHQAICFGLAQRWFGCRVHPNVGAAIRSLPSGITHWLDRYGHSPLAAAFRPNKDELWLHWTLLQSRRKRLLVVKRKLFPSRLPRPFTEPHSTREGLSWKNRLGKRCQYLQLVCKRMSYHLSALLPTARSAVQWFGASWASRHFSKRS